MLVNLIVADRIAPRYRSAAGPEDEIIERYRTYVAPYSGRLRVLVALFFALSWAAASRPSGAAGCCSELRRLRAEGSAVRQGHRLLRVPPAVPRVRGRVGVRGAARRAHRDRGVPLPERRHPAAEPVAARHAAGEGPPLGDPRAHGADEDRAVLPRPLRAGVLAARLRRRCELHGREGAAAGAQPADDHLDRGGGAVHRQHLPQGLGVPDHRGRAVGVHLARRRHDLSRGHPAVRRAAQRVLTRRAVHRAQHRVDARPRSGSTTRSSTHKASTTRRTSTPPTSSQRRDVRQHPALGSCAAAAGVPRAAGAVPVLPVQRRRRRPLHGRQPTNCRR